MQSWQHGWEMLLASACYWYKALWIVVLGTEPFGMLPVVGTLIVLSF